MNSRDLRIRRQVATCLAAIAGLLVAVAATGPASASVATDREWRFRVLLDDKEIGYHRFQLQEAAGTYRLTSEADFRVRFLFFDAYRYRHVNEETWRGDCLERVEAQTDVNGESLAVRGRLDPDGFVVATGESSRNLGECVMSFAYWNPDFLDQDQLLNTQTGEYVPVRIEPVQQERLEIRGQKVDAIRYSLEAGKLAMRLWYTPDREWLALESTAKGGRLLRYELR